MPKIEKDVRTPALSIEVTQAVIDAAIPKNSGHCVVADAIKESLKTRFGKKGTRVSVDIFTCRVTNQPKRLRYIYKTPQVAQKALIQFDQGIKPTPFRFRLNGGQVTRMQSGGKQKASNGKKRERRHTATVNVENLDSDKNVRRPTKIGGKVPPVAALAGNRRQFGIRALGDLAGPTDPRSKVESLSPENIT